MREVTVKIPEERFEFFMELFEQLGIETNLEYEIPEAHKAIVIERIKQADLQPKELLDWDEVKDDFDFK
jgi:hypothetical protein